MSVVTEFPLAGRTQTQGSPLAPLKLDHARGAAPSYADGVTRRRTGPILAARLAPVTEIPAEVRQLVRERVPTMDDVEVLMRLRASPDVPLSTREVEAAARLGPETTLRALRHLAREELVRHDPAADSWLFQPKTAAERRAVEALYTLYNQRPVTLVKLIYEQPATPLRLFSDAFRLRKEEGEE